MLIMGQKLPAKQGKGAVMLMAGQKQPAGQEAHS
jgi:hypothetical protein